MLYNFEQHFFQEKRRKKEVCDQKIEKKKRKKEREESFGVNGKNGVGQETVNQPNCQFGQMISCSSADMIRGINDPEHPLTLEELNVVEESKVKVRLKFCSKISLFSHKLIKNTTQYYIVICLAFPLYAIFETVCFV